jgi:hypothetical protein
MTTGNTNHGHIIAVGERATQFHGGDAGSTR